MSTDTAASTAPPRAPVQRPDGRWYQPRKPPRAVCWEDVDHRSPDGVTVLGTHDRAVGDQLAIDAFRYYCGVDYADPEGSDGALPEPRAGWTRLAMRNGDRQYVEDPVRGRPSLTYQDA